jgi:hypothetical protein
MSKPTERKANSKMKTLLFFLVLLSPIANAGIVKVTTYPVRHSVRSVRRAGRVVFFPLIHPVRTGRVIKRVIW